MSLNVIFKWLNNDSTADLNQRFAVTFAKGITDGADLVPNGLSVAVTPFKAMTDSGLLVQDTSTYTFQNIPLNQATVLTVYAKWIQAGEPIIEYRAYEVSVFDELEDKGDHIVFGMVTLGVGESAISDSNITYDRRDVFDRLGRSPFRGFLATSTELPADHNRDSDFYIVGGGGGLVEIYAWNGTTWLNLTNTLALQNTITSHRNNMYVDEKHLTDDQKDAAIGSMGAPSITNRYVTEQDTARLLDGNEKQALQGSHGTPSNTNPFVTTDYPFTEPHLLTLAGGGRIEIVGLPHPVYVGKGLVGSSNTYFALVDLNNDRGYINASAGKWPKIVQVYKDSGETQPLNPSVDADADGFYHGNLYITVDQPIDTSCRVSFSIRRNLGNVDKGFDAKKGPASDFVSGEVIQHIQNIKGKPFDTYLDSDESNKALREDVDDLISYLGSNQNTTIVATDEDYNYFKADSKLGPVFIKNMDVPVTYTLENNTYPYTYSATTGVVTYTGGVPDLTATVKVGNIFISGNGVEYRITARTANTISIVNSDTGLRPSQIVDNVLPGGHCRVNNNPRNILMSELKAHAQEVIKIDDLYRLKEFSRPEGRPAFGISQGGKRIDPRVVLYGSCTRRANPDTGEVEVVFTSNTGDIQITDFISELWLWCKVTPGAPNLAVSLNNEQVQTTVSISQGGTASPTLANISGERFQKVKIIGGLDSNQVTTVNMRLTGALVDPLVIAGLEVITIPPKKHTISFNGEAVSGTFRITYNANSTPDIPYDASLNQLQTAIRTIPGLGSAHIQVNQNGDIVILYTSPNSFPITVTDNLLLDNDNEPVVATVLNDLGNADIKLTVEAGIGFENTRVNSKPTRTVQSVFPASNTTGANYTTILDKDLVDGSPIINIINTAQSNLDFDPDYVKVKMDSSTLISPTNDTEKGKYLSAFKVGDVIELIGTDTQIVRIENYYNDQITVSPAIQGVLEDKEIRMVASLGSDAPDELGEEIAARYEIITDFIDYSTTDFSVKNSAAKTKRYVVHKDGQTIVSANNTSLSIDRRSVVVAPSVGKLSFGVCGPRLDLEFNNATPVTIRVSIDGSTQYNVSVPAGVTRKTIFNRSRHTFHEVHITSLQEFQVTHMTIYSLERGINRTRPMLSTQDNVSPYTKEFTAPYFAINKYRYSLGKVFFDALKYAIFTKAAGPDSTWSVIHDQNEFLGRYIVTENHGDKVSYNFVGSGIEIAYLRANDGGVGTIQIDGVDIDQTTAVVESQGYSGNELDTYESGTATGMRLMSITNLNYGSHTITITNDRVNHNPSGGYKLGIFGFFEVSIDGKLRNTYDVVKGHYTPVSDVREFASFYAGLIGESAFPIQTAVEVKSAYAKFDGSIVPIGCGVTSVLGLTRINLSFNYIPGANPGYPFGELLVVIDGKVLPRFVAGSTNQAYYKEINSNTIELDNDYSTSPFDIQVLKINGPTEVDLSGLQPYDNAIKTAGQLGDLVQSALNLAQFQALRDTTWVAANGASIVGSALHALTGATTAPNVAGHYVKINY